MGFAVKTNEEIFGDLHEAINKCAGELPDNFQIKLITENGAAWVELDYNGERVWRDGNYPDHDYAERYLLALDAALNLVKTNSA